MRVPRKIGRFSWCERLLWVEGCSLDCGAILYSPQRWLGVRRLCDSGVCRRRSWTFFKNEG